MKKVGRASEKGNTDTPNTQGVTLMHRQQIEIKVLPRRFEGGISGELNRALDVRKKEAQVTSYDVRVLVLATCKPVQFGARKATNTVKTVAKYLVVAGLAAIVTYLINA